MSLAESHGSLDVIFQHPRQTQLGDDCCHKPVSSFFPPSSFTPPSDPLKGTHRINSQRQPLVSAARLLRCTGVNDQKFHGENQPNGVRRNGKKEKKRAGDHERSLLPRGLPPHRHRFLCLHCTVLTSRWPSNVVATLTTCQYASSECFPMGDTWWPCTVVD